MKKIIVVMLMIAGISLWATDFGAVGAADKDNFTLEDMLLYALQDEHLARAEYEAIMEEFGVDRPYSNIMMAEETHIGYVEGLYSDLGWEIPAVDTSKLTLLPSSLEEAAQIGVKAEVENIAMYEKFLAMDLPENVRVVFEDLKESSEKHLTAFERQVERGASGQGSGRQSDRPSEGRGRNETDDHHS